jgi:5-methylcytosine-specific restriction endonuclease McrA
MSPTRLCLEPRCPNPATVRGRCADHAAVRRKETRSVNDSWYSSKPWKLSRRKQLHDHPLCQYVDPATGVECGEIADSVHHRKPIEDGGARRDPANLMSVCRPHHSTIHAQMGMAAPGRAFV